MDTNNTNSEKKNISDELKCSGCGAILKFKPGTHNLTCTYCGAENIIEPSTETIEEIDFEKFIRTQYENEEKIDVVSVKCPACGAAITLEPNVTSDHCPYCSSNIVVEGGSTSTMLKPKSLLPFAVNREKATESFKNWIHKLWFAPSDLKQKAAKGKLDGIYIPYWTYDAYTGTHYTGARGTYYYVTETYTTTENGQTVTKTRQVRRTSWTSTSGHVNNRFDDILVIASRSLPGNYTQKLEPWNLKDLVPYNDKYLSGFRSESYQVSIVEGLEIAKERMIPEIRSTVYKDIGGDEQRIYTMNTSYNNVTFKHILLPIWISSYRYKDKLYRFLINGQTGEVQGERPYSAVKILLAVLAVIAIIALVVIIAS
jgi:LSD1 subclass zinc finger protein